MLDPQGIQDQWDKECDKHFDTGKDDICPTCKYIYDACKCGHEGDEPNW